MNNWDSQLINAIEKFSDDIAEKTKNAVDDIANETMNEIKSHITFKQRTGKYVRAFRLKTTFENAFDKRVTWYVASPQHRLTHLLENGHMSRDGTSRVKAYPHIKFGEEYARENLEKEIIKKING